MSSSLRPLAMLCAASVCAYLTMGIALGTIPGFVQHTLRYGPLLVGVAIAAQSVATLLTRVVAGHVIDRHGAKPGLMIGMCGAAAAGIASLVAGMIGPPVLAFGALIVARIILGLGESFTATGALTWGVARLGPQRSGAVMVWVGIALYGALGFGAPIGATIAAHVGFSAAAAFGAAVAAVGLLLVSTLETTPIATGRRTPFARVILNVLPSGISLATSIMGFSAIGAFVTLLFAQRGWPGGAVTLAVFSTGFIAARFIFGSYPDRFGGRRVAAVSLAGEAVGMLALYFAPGPLVAFLGAAIVGAGYSIAYPALGVEAVRDVPPQSRGSALGAYTMFFDAGLAIMGPVNGWIGSHDGVPTIYLVGAFGPLVAVAIVLVFIAPDVRQRAAAA